MGGHMHLLNKLLLATLLSWGTVLYFLGEDVALTHGGGDGGEDGICALRDSWESLEITCKRTFEPLGLGRGRAGSPLPP